MNRYASNWAFYLGHHWSYRREIGEPQLTFNWTKVFSDFLTNFALTNSVSFQSPHATQAIIPELLRTVWDEHQPYGKDATLWELHQQGSVSGDCFVKVAWEEPYVDPAGNDHPGRIRILPLNSAFCMPVEENEILTRRGWLSADEVEVGDQALALDAETDDLVWADVEAVNIFDWDGPLHEWRSERFSAASTPDHRWIMETGRGNRRVRTSEDLSGVKSGGGAKLILAGGTPVHFPYEKKYDDDFVELVGWVVSEGGLEQQSAGFQITQSLRRNADFCARIERLARSFENKGLSIWRGKYEGRSSIWRFPAELGHAVRAVITEKKAPLPEFLRVLTFHQAQLLFDTIMDGDGDTRRSRGEFLWEDEPEVHAALQMLAAMLGKRSQSTFFDRDRGNRTTRHGCTTVYQSRAASLGRVKKSVRHYRGRVWCPTTSVGTWVTRRKEVTPQSDTSHRSGEQGSIFKSTVYVTGNCFPELSSTPHTT